MARLLLFCSSSRPTTVRTRQRKRRVLSSLSSWASSSRRPWCRSEPRTPRPSCGNGAAAAPVVEGADGGGGAVPSGRKRMLAASLSGIGSKAAAIAKMVSWNRRSAGSGSSSDDEEAAAEVEDEEAVWRKAIIMGDKCRPLQFSGHIAFDSDGNQLPPAPAKKAAADVAEN